jgi:hypothetical protein
LVMPGYADPAQVQVPMSVSATVVEAATFRFVQHVTTLVVSRGDVERGYIDVSEGSHVRVTSARPFLFELAIVGAIVRAAYASEAGVSLSIGSGGATLLRRPGVGGSSEMSIDYHIELLPNAAPGVYPWPLRLTVLPM